MTLELFKVRLFQHLHSDIELVVNENRSTMLSLSYVGRNMKRLSLHKMFLQAPDLVISAIAHYVRGSKKEMNVLRQYIQDHLTHANYTHLLKKNQLEYQGRIYNLKTIYDEINAKYFKKELELSITWFGHLKKRRKGTCITFGQYLGGLRLIKIHRMLDHVFFPEYFVAFVVYHEMLHHVITPTVSPKGRTCFHGPAFKKREKEFEDYIRAIEWEKRNKISNYSPL